MMSYFLIVSTCIKMKTMKSTKEKKYSVMIIFHFGGHLGLKSYIVFCEILKILLILKKLHRLDFPTKFAYTLTKKLDVKFLTPPLQGKAEMILYHISTQIVLYMQFRSSMMWTIHVDSRVLTMISPVQDMSL